MDLAFSLFLARAFCKENDIYIYSELLNVKITVIQPGVNYINTKKRWTMHTRSLKAYVFFSAKLTGFSVPDIE